MSDQHYKKLTREEEDEKRLLMIARRLQTEQLETDKPLPGKATGPWQPASAG